MFKYLAKLVYWPDKLQDAEFDIESLPVVSVERDSERRTCIGYLQEEHITAWYVTCNLTKHQSFVDRFRNKIKGKSL